MGEAGRRTPWEKRAGDNAMEKRAGDNAMGEAGRRQRHGGASCYLRFTHCQASRTQSTSDEPMMMMSQSESLRPTTLKNC